MSLSGSARRGLVCGVLASALLMAASCYQAEIDLTPPADDTAEAGGGVSSSGGAHESTAEGGAPIAVASASGAGGAGAAGVASAGGCDDGALDPIQEVCHDFLLPTRADCHDGDPAGWDGCYAGGCAVCSEKLAEFPYYKAWHPCCEINDTCNRNAPVTCNYRCPPPTEHDKVAPCFVIPP